EKRLAGAGLEKPSLKTAPGKELLLTRLLHLVFETAPTFLCGMQRKVGAAPHRGNANRPLTIQGKALKPEEH
ncbi:hypothetical protein, partial [Paraburkholderia dipogonis]|uniref:hypothetical protein n=1 Tax=Paraburkholderia dipogonis TaxID=1211383 RepID=UPI0038BA18AE